MKHNFYEISTTISGEERNHFTCDDYNREGRYCGQYTDDYGPGVFSDMAPPQAYIDCSKHGYLWIYSILHLNSFDTISDQRNI